MSAATGMKFKHDLKRAIPLNTLSEEEFVRVMENSVFVSVAKGEQIMQQGDTDHYNVYLLKGTLSLHDKNREIDRVSARESSARFPIAHQVPRKYSVRAEIKSEIAKVDNRLLGELLLKKGDASYKVEDFDSRSKDDWMSQLLRLPAFQQIPAANMQGVMLRMEELEVKKGETVIQEGDEGDYFYLINQGRCQVAKKFLGEEPQAVAELGPGDSFGEEALLSNKPRGSSVTMLTDGVLVRLAKEDFLQFVKRPVTQGVRPADAEARVEEGAVWLDIRPQAAWEKEHLHDSINIPLPALRYQASSLAPETTYIVCCDDGQLSSTAAFLLRERGLDALVLTGGLSTLHRTRGTASSQADTGSEAPRPGPSAEDVSAAIDELKSALATSNAALKHLEDENLAYREEALRLREKLGAGKEALAALQRELESVRLESESVTAQQNTRAEERIQRLESEKGRLTEMLTESSAEQERLADALAAQADRRESEDRQHLDTVSRLEAQLAEAQRAGEASAADLATLRQELQAQADELERERVRATALDQALASARRETVEDETRRAQELRELQEALEKAGTLRRDAEQALALLREESEKALREKENGNRVLNEALEERAERAATLETSLSALQSSNQECVEKHAADMASLQRQLDELVEEKSGLVARLEAQELNEATLRAERDKFTRESQAYAAKLEHAAAQAEEVAQLAEELQRERAVGDERRERLESLQTALDETGLRLSQTESELEGIRAETESLQVERLEQEETAAQHAEAQRKREETMSEALESARRDTLAAEEKLDAKLVEADALSARVLALESARREEGEAQAKAIETLRSELTQAEGRTEELGATVNDLRAALETREDELRQAAERTAALEAAVAKEGERSSEQLRASKIEIEALRKSLEAQEQRLASERGESARAREALDASTAELVEEKASLEETVQTLRAENQVIGAERSRLIERLEELDARNDEATAREQENPEAIAVLRSDVEAARREADQHREALERSQSEISRLESRLSETESDAEQLRTIVAELREQNQELTAGIETEEASALKSELHLIRTQALSEAGSLEREVKELTEALAEAKRSAGSALDETSQLRAQLADREEEVGELRKNMIAVERLTGDHEKEIEKRENTIHRQQQHITQLKRTAETRNETQVAEITDLKRALGSSESRIRLLEKSAETSEKERAASEKQIARLQVRLNSQSDAVEFGHPGLPAPAKRSWGLGVAGLLAGLAAGALSAPYLAPKIEPVVELVYARFGNTGADPAHQAAPLPEKRAIEPVDGRAAPPDEAPAPGAAAKQSEQPADTKVVTQPPTLNQLLEPVRDRLRNGRRGPEMIELPAGTFSMGSARSLLSPEEQPERQVEVGRFLIGRYEVTFEEYALFASATGRRLPDNNGWGGGKRPVVNVKWSDAAAYAAWLSRQTGKKYRLPSEAEWEYAARAGTGTIYWWGYQPETNRANCFNCGSEWDGRSTAPVGSFEPNPYGVHDTAGNVMEWVADCFHGSYKGAPEDGRPWIAGECNQRMIRGGAFNKPADTMKSTKRLWNDENATLSNLGFRLARDVDAKP